MIEDVGGTAVTLGAAYGAVQAVAQFLMLVLPKHTIGWRISKFIVSGPSRQP